MKKQCCIKFKGGKWTALVSAKIVQRNLIVLSWANLLCTRWRISVYLHLNTRETVIDISHSLPRSRHVSPWHNLEQQFLRYELTDFLFLSIRVLEQLQNTRPLARCITLKPVVRATALNSPVLDGLKNQECIKLECYRGPQSHSGVLNWSANAVRSPVVEY